MPDFPLTFRKFPRPGVMPSLSLFIAGKDGSSVQVQSAGIIVLQLVLGARAPINATLPFNTSMTTADMNRNLNDMFAMATLPAGISYEGLNNGFPTFTANDDFDFSVAVHVTTDPVASVAGFDVGYVAYGAVPEPTTVSMLLIALGCLALVALLQSHRREASTGGIAAQ